MPDSGGAKDAYGTAAMRAALNLYTLHREAPDSFWETAADDLPPEARKLIWQMRAQDASRHFHKGKKP